ncbi:MAG TPA: hypothetical protein PLJ97_03200 [Candidatus Saccharibacteria bacterium]|nr:hypothetical protein [Candidatus Saccharibacteria bacterium]
MRTLVFVVLSMLVLVFLSPGASFAISISASGGWSETIDENDLVAGAGSDLKSTYESATNATLLTISGCQNSDDTWQVKVSYSSSNWPFSLSVKKSGGNYQTITTTQATFFSGSGDTSNIALQYKLEGMSIKIAPGTYSTTITYTVVDT